MDSYNRDVKERIPLPKLREKTEQTHSANKTTLSDNKSLSVEELNKLGNGYLEVAKRRGRKREGSSPDQVKRADQSVLVTVAPPRSIQRDYLAELRRSNPSPEKYGDMNRLKRILHSNSENPNFERISEAMILADKM